MAPAVAVTYRAVLTSATQNPPIAGPEATCAGTVTIAVTGASVKFNMVVTACPATTAINIGHIHEGVTGANGPVRVDTTLTAGQIALTGGGITISKTAPIEAAIATAIAANPAGFYFNMHSTANAGGVIRGQLTRG